MKKEKQLLIRRNFEGYLWIISGEIGAGKTVLCASLIKAFEDLGWQISGLRSPAIMEAGNKTGIAVENLSTKEIRQLAVHDYKPDGLEDEPIHWTFDPQVLMWGNQVFTQAVPTDLLVVDEIGPLEMKREQGWVNALRALDSRQYRQAILVMRPKLLAMSQSRWPWASTIEIETVEQVPAITIELMREWKSGI
jgi:nucleoside-triphosphatase